jgi:hypothetical protein
MTEKAMIEFHKIWGDTCPILNISRHYGFDYGDCLLVADYHTNGRYSIPSEFSEREDRDGTWRDCCLEIYLYSQRFKALRAGATG